MADEVTVPLLPCASIDDVATFYEVLGFRTTYRQRKPNPYVAVQRDDLGLHFFELEGFDPAQSYGSCLVVTPDLEGLHGAFAKGLRGAHGKVPVSGIPRMTRPRKRKNYDGVSGFSVVDPGGNWIRFVRKGPEPDAAPAPVGALGKAMANAVVQADSRGNVEQAVRILDTALAKPDAAADPAALVEALVYRAELATVLGDPDTAADLLARATGLGLTPDQAEHAADLAD